MDPKGRTRGTRTKLLWAADVGPGSCNMAALSIGCRAFRRQTSLQTLGAAGVVPEDLDSRFPANGDRVRAPAVSPGDDTDRFLPVCLLRAARRRGAAGGRAPPLGGLSPISSKTLCWVRMARGRGHPAKSTGFVDSSSKSGMEDPAMHFRGGPVVRRSLGERRKISSAYLLSGTMLPTSTGDGLTGYQTILLCANRRANMSCGRREKKGKGQTRG